MTTKQLIRICISSVMMAVLLVGCMGPGPINNPTTSPNNQTEENISEGVEKTQEEVALPIPPLIEDTDPSENKTAFEITAEASSRAFVDGVETDTLGYNGDYLGPTIKVRRGEEVSATITNEMEDLTTIHWHGLEVDAEDDGGPHSGILPGASWNPEFTIDQPAATLWYHPHPEKDTGRQVYNGLAGMFIIEDDVTDQLPLPKDYGENDIPLIIQDKRFDQNGNFKYDLQMPDIMTGLMGDTMLVNGAVAPELDTEQGLMRFRILNGSNARVFELELNNHQSFYQIASDGGLLEQPVEMNRLVLGPAERAEIVIDFSDVDMGESRQLMNEAVPFMTFNVNKEPTPGIELPDQLTTIEEIPTSESVTTREFVFQGMGPSVNINGKQFDMDRIDEVVELNTTEIWEVTNDSGMGMMGGTVHPFHAHGVQFQIISRDGNPPPPNETGWKDTFIVYPGETVRAIARFKHEGVFMYHCHILEHEDAGMMGQFDVRD
ncbi:MAG: multicopper oxidase family protein [Bacillota bacterium]